MTVEARPLHLLSRNTLQSLTSHVQRSLADLVAGWWSMDHCVQVVGVTPWDDVEHGSSIRAVVRGEEGRWLAFLGSDQVWRRIIGTWLECEVPATGAMTSELERTFCVDVYRALTGSETAVVTTADGWSQVGSAVRSIGSGAITIELDIDGVPLQCLAPIALWPEHSGWPAMRAGRSVPVALHQALSDTTLPLDMRLPQVRMHASELADLRAGDFVNLELGLATVARIVTCDGSVELPATLGESAGHRAVRINKQQVPTK